MIVTLDDIDRKYVVKFRYEGRKTTCLIKKVVDGIDHKTWPILREESVTCHPHDNQNRAVGRTLAFAKAVGNVIAGGVILSPLIADKEFNLKLEDTPITHKVRQAFWKVYKQTCTAKFLKYIPNV